MESHAWAAFPQIPKAIETRFYQGSPQDIEAFIKERRKQADQLISEVTLLLKKEREEENKRTLTNALEFLEGIPFQLTRLNSEMKRSPEVAVIAPVIGLAPYSLEILDEVLSLYPDVKQGLDKHQKKKKLFENNLSNIEQDLKHLFADYINFKEQDNKDIKGYETLSQLLSLQAEYALQKVQCTKLDQTIDKLSSSEKDLNNQIKEVFKDLKITKGDVVAAENRRNQARYQERDIKDKLIARRRGLNRQIIISEIKLDNVITKLNSVKSIEESKKLLNIEKRRLEKQLEELQYKKDILSQNEIAIKLDTSWKSFRYDWLAYYTNYPQSKKPQAIVKYCTEELDRLEEMVGQLKENLAERRLDKSIVNENLFLIAKEREAVTSPKVKKALRVLQQQLNVTNDSMDKLILKISDNLKNVKVLRTETQNILQLVQQRISLYERLLYWIRADFSVAWSRVKAVVYYPLWSIGESAVTLATFLKVIFFLSLGIFSLRVVRKKLATFLIERASLSIGLVNSITSLSYYFLLLLIVLVALSTAGVNLNQITIILGALGVGIGFGLQTIANNFISGLILLTERTIKVGDIVELENDLLGEVKNISIRSTVIRTYDSLDIIVPNSDFISNRVTTWTYGDDWRRLRIPFGVSYGSDPDEVAKLAIEVAKEIPTTIEDGDHHLRVWFEGFGDSSLDFSLLVWCRMRRLAPVSGLLSDYYFALFRKFKEAGIEIPFPQRDLHLRSISPEISHIFKK
jgi:small-conductance mechanosensitive channel/outer membrane murein-binding lipoprotein Lpp